MTQQYSDKQPPSAQPAAAQSRPLSAYEQAQVQQLMAQVVSDSALPQPQARWLGQRLWQHIRQNRFSLSQLRRWLQYQQDKISHLLRYLSPRPHLWRQGGLALALVVGLTVSSLSHPLLALAQDPVGTEFQVNTTNTSTQSLPSVGVAADGDFVITWMSDEQDGDWYGIYAQRYDTAGIPQGDEFLVNTTTMDDQRYPSVGVAADGDFVIAWMSDGQDGDGSGIYAQRYKASGIPQGDEFLVNTTTTAGQSTPSVGVAADGDFVITWMSYEQDGDWYGIYAQRYKASGVPQGNEFLVNTTTTNSQVFPSVGVADDGDFVITWQSNYQDGEQGGIYARRYNAKGIPQGDEFQVNTYTSNYQIAPHIGVASDGDFVITWMSDGQDGDGSGIYARRYNASGTPQSREFRVNNTTTNSQRSPNIGIAADGDFVITWDSLGQDGDDYYGIYARRYNASGTAQGDEFRVNSYTTEKQQFPNIGIAADGDFIITWESYEQDGDSYGIYARRYAANGVAQGSEFRGQYLYHK